MIVFLVFFASYLQRIVINPLVGTLSKMYGDAFSGGDN